MMVSLFLRLVSVPVPSRPLGCVVVAVPLTQCVDIVQIVCRYCVDIYLAERGVDGAGDGLPELRIQQVIVTLHQLAGVSADIHNTSF